MTAGTGRARIGFLSGCSLKLLAAATMVVDHVGAILFPQYLWLRCIGRLSFPIFAFLLGEGFCHTRDVSSYIGRVFLFALLSEPCFDLAFHSRLFDLYGQNIFFTLGISLLAMEGMRRTRFLWEQAVWIAAACAAAEFLRADYGAEGVLMALAFYLFRENLALTALSAVLLNVVVMGGIQSYGALAILPVACYSGEKGRGMKYFFYTFYPLHLLALAGIRALMGGM